MKKYIALIIIMALLLPQLMTIPSLADGESSGNSNIITITTGEEFASKVVTANFGKTFIIDGTQTLADGSKGIIITSDSVSGFYGTIKGVEGKNNIQIQKPLITTVGGADTGDVVIDNIVLKGSKEDGTGEVSHSDHTSALINSAQTNATNKVTITNVINYLNVTSTGSAKTAGGILGYVRYRKVTVENCINKGEITANNGDAAAGGIVGRFYGATGEVADIKNCSNEGKITSSGCAAGILGKGTPKDGGNIQYCANSGAIKSTSTKGTSAGAAGISFHYVPTSYCFNAGKVESTSMAGGIWGTSTSDTKVSDCFNLGEVSSTNDSCKPAGIVGSYNKTVATVTNCYNLGDIEGTNAVQIIDNETTTNDNKCTNNYYVSDTDLGQVGKNITFEELAKSDWWKDGEDFSEDIWEILPTNLRGDYINDDINCPSGYRYPQIKGNWIDHKFEADIESFEDYRSSSKGEITNVSAGWDHVENVSNGISIYGTNDLGTKLVKKFTYPALFGSDLIKGDMTPSNDLSFDINKTAEVILAVNTSDVDSLDVVANGEFNQMFEKDGVTPLAFVTDGGLVYYLVKKDVPSSGTITIAAQSGLTNNFVVFVNWLNTYKLSIKKSGNEKVYIKSPSEDEYAEKTNDEDIVALGGSSYNIKVTPYENYYIKSITLNGKEIEDEKNEVVSFEKSYNVSENLSFEIKTSPYTLLSTNLTDGSEPIISQETRGDKIVQSFNIKGTTELFWAEKGGKIILSYQFGNKTKTVEKPITLENGKGNFTIDSELEDEEFGNCTISLQVVIEGVTSDVILSDGSEEKVVTIESVKTVNNLFADLGNESDQDPNNDLTLDDFKETYLNKLPFNTGLFNQLDQPIQQRIFDAWKGENPDTIEELYSVFDKKVIIETVKNSEKSDDFKHLIEVYADTIGIDKKSEIYKNYEALSNPEPCYAILKGRTYENLSDILNAFEYGVLYAELSNVTSYDSILDILKRYIGYDDEAEKNGELRLLGTVIKGCVDTIETWVDAMIKIVTDELGNSLKSLVTVDKLEGKLTELDSEEVGRLLAEKMGQLNPPPSTGGGGGGGGGTDRISVEKDYTEKEPITPVYSEEVVNEFVDLGDVPWAQDHIRSLYKRGIVRGKELGKFYPQDKVTRAEFVKMVVVAFSLMEEEPSCEYKDVTEDHWSYKYVASAADIGIVSGYSKDEFGVNGYITRQDMVAILIRIVYNLSLYEKMENRKISTADFTDIDTVSDYAKGGVVMLANSGIISGYEDGSFGPNNDVTRAEAATVLARVLDFFEI